MADESEELEQEQVEPPVDAISREDVIMKYVAEQLGDYFEEQERLDLPIDLVEITRFIRRSLFDEYMHLLTELEMVKRERDFYRNCTEDIVVSQLKKIPSNC
jgi:hypothetical protein